ncbi:hypothetical protein [Cellulosimicrobium sp. I38E]|uniref:hypothetical protein n=1 Tax=Cellulosimicrobium sp. I38E TaxID=1393139 RepID=UPI0012E95CF3|nr:hypothetical protein [Cellulosimicrobium sp. I38E]
MKVDALSLDLNNYRFAVAQPDEAMAFNDLFEGEDVMSVARSLLHEGYRTNEVPLVVEEEGWYVVLEANRRVSALRALRDPSLVPNHRHKLEALVKRYQADADDLPDEIYVTVYPDRGSAAPVLARQHIGADKKSWGLDEQARFVLAQLAGGADVATLKATLTGIKDVPRLVRMGRVRQALHSTPFTDPALASYATGRELKMSAFEYAYKDRALRPLMGFEFDGDGNLVAQPRTPAQVAVLERLLRGFEVGELSTRKVLNDKKGADYAKLVDELQQLAGVVSPDAPAPIPTPPTPAPSTVGPPGTPPPGAPDAAPTTSPSGGGTDTKVPGAALVRPNHPDTKRKLYVTVDFSRLPSGLQKRFLELQRIDVEAFPAAAAMLLRSVVESSVKHHYAVRGDHRVSGTLNEVVRRLADDYKKVVKSLDKQISLLQNGLSPRLRPGSGDWFNAAAHDPNSVVNDQQVREAWQELEPLVRFLIQPPVSSTS